MLVDLFLLRFVDLALFLLKFGVLAFLILGFMMFLEIEFPWITDELWASLIF